MGLSAVGCVETPPCSTSSTAADDKASPAAEEEDKVAAADDSAVEAADAAAPDLADVSTRPFGRAVVADLVDGLDGFMSLRQSVSKLNGLKMYNPFARGTPQRWTGYCCKHDRRGDTVASTTTGMYLV